MDYSSDISMDNNSLNQGPKKTILLVEDDQSLASVYMSRLETEGYDVTHVQDGEKALSEASKLRPDLVILDIMMPKIGGFDVLDLLRGSDSTRNCKIMMLTALSQDKDRERAESLGVDGYLVKSQVMLDEIVDKVRELIS